jgi:radical SAM-linked protein
VDANPGPAAPVAEPRQRWRLTFSRGSAAAAIPHREVAEAWLAGLVESALPLPLPRAEGARPRSPLTFAAALPVGVAVERDLADLVLAERLAVWVVRDAAVGAAPDGIQVTDLHDVWLGGPPLAAIAGGADYRMTIDAASDPGVEPLRRAAAQLLAAATIPRERPKGSGSVGYDLRPLLASIHVSDGPGARTILARTLFHPERGAGRPDEVLAALGDLVGCRLVAGTTVRERVILTEELAEELANEPANEPIEGPAREAPKAHVRRA